MSERRVGSQDGRQAKVVVGTEVTQPQARPSPNADPCRSRVRRQEGGKGHLRSPESIVPKVHWCSPALSERGWLSVLGSTSPWDATSGVLSTQPPSSALWGSLLSRVMASRWEKSFETLVLREEAGSGGNSLLGSAPSERGPGEDRNCCQRDTRAPSPQITGAIWLAGDQGTARPSPGFTVGLLTVPQSFLLCELSPVLPGLFIWFAHGWKSR